ncbi:hypothetical protein Dvina_19155 [Dactylosporangium vinaceum]|uniref:Lipoprotein n=1 Tax=Dactylosporangium vinaceum TaxID=53362 RepID=A0ABV5M9G1_9ACTN|nr:hypothetical protein [Dactylosporangium vinaceum]UAB99982.1 hypothetical protein Dvina_19155 [Dactylosporangium vinaceum]
MRSTAVIIITLLLLSGCGSQEPPAAAATPFLTALGRISATDNTRKQIVFSETAAMVKLTEGRWSQMSVRGAQPFGPEMEQFGIVTKAANWSITAGAPPSHVMVIDGGQDTALVKSSLQKLGYTLDGDILKAPTDYNEALTASIAPLLPQARVTGSDVLVAGRSGTFTDVTTDAGTSLAADARVKAIVDCLGDVVTADIYTTFKAVPAVAVGVRRPQTSAATAQAVVCTAWTSTDAAKVAASQQENAYATGSSRRSQKAYNSMYSTVTVKVLDGPQHLVQVLSTAGSPSYVFDQLNTRDLPGVPL